MAALVGSLFPGFVERYQDRLETSQLALCERFVAGLEGWLDSLSGPRTVTHGDFRLDNLLFRPGDPRPWVVDWQTASWGMGASDLSYFLGGSLTVADRRATSMICCWPITGRWWRRGCPATGSPSSRTTIG